MPIVRVDKKSLIKKFVDFPDSLYSADNNYVPYIKSDLTKTLTKLVLKEKTYVALLSTEGERVQGRILLTVSHSKSFNTDNCCYFSMFECVHDQSVCDELLREAVKVAKSLGATYFSGPYFPHDPDNRRGVLVEGFERAPLIFTSYNKKYYDSLLKNFGLKKHTDALEYKFEMNNVPKYEKVKKASQFAKNKFKFHIDAVNWRHIDKDIADVHTVMTVATSDVIYQDAPDIAMLQSIVKSWKKYLDKDYLLIARADGTEQPLGVVIALPDFFEVFKKMKGETNLKELVTFAKQRKKISSVRAIMQYVIPKYQSLGVTMALYCQLYEAMSAKGINYVEAGTIMEKNPQSNNAITGVGGALARVYRIYYKEIE